jgi:hypothetical protein
VTLLEARGVRGLDGELARRRVERRGHREDHVLTRERELRIALRHAVLPRVGDVLEVAERGLHRAHLLDVLGGTEREEGRATIDAGVREPALRARDHSARSLDTPRPRELPHDVRAAFVPREGHGPVGGVRGVVERGQEGLLSDGPFGDELRDVEHLHLARATLGELGVREGRVGGAEIDPDDVAAQSSTSACATTVAS